MPRPGRILALSSLFALAATTRVNVHDTVAEGEAASEPVQELPEQALLEVEEEGGEVEEQTLAEDELEAYEEAALDEAAEQEDFARDNVEAEEETDVDLTQVPSIAPPKQYRLAHIAEHASFEDNDNPVLVQDLVPQFGESLIVKVIEHAKFSRNSEYTWEVAGQNRQPFRSPVALGRLRSSAIGNSFVFNSNDGNKVFMIKKWRDVNPFSYETTKFFLTDKEGDQVYYTIEKTFGGKHHYGGGFGGGRSTGYGGGYSTGYGPSYGGGYNGGHAGGYHHNHHGKHLEHLNVYLGKCTKRCSHPLYTGSGHKKGLNYMFYRSGVQGPVARMDREYARYGALGRNDEFVMTVEANTDTALMMAAVSIMDVLNNQEGD